MIDIISLIHLNAKANKIPKKELNRTIAFAIALLNEGRKKGGNLRLLESRIILRLPEWVNSIKRR